MPSPGLDIQSWSTTAINNTTADPSINWQEGQARASLNDSSRAMMAATALDRNLKNGSITTAGTANAQTFASGVSYTSVPTGLQVRLKIGASLTNTGAMTLNMDAIGAVSIKTSTAIDPPAGAIRAGDYCDFLYNGTNWIFIGGAFATQAVAAGGLANVRVFTASGTYPTITNGGVAVLVKCVGGGGGGGSSTGNNGGGGGGSGQVSWKFTTAAALSAQTVTVGTGGAGASINVEANGIVGVTSSIGTVVTAPGGNPGEAGSAGGSGGLGGVGGTNTWGEGGGHGGTGGNITGTGIGIYGHGGGPGGGRVGNPGTTNTGGGGGGGASFTAAGAGAAGIIICFEYGAI